MIQELLKKIEDSYYWDARVKSLECNYFGDEEKVVFEDDEKNITYFFQSVIKWKLSMQLNSKRQTVERTYTPTDSVFYARCRIQRDRVMSEKYMEFKINMYPIELLIVCKNLIFIRLYFRTFDILQLLRSIN